MRLFPRRKDKDKEEVGPKVKEVIPIEGGGKYPSRKKLNKEKGHTRKQVISRMTDVEYQMVRQRACEEGVTMSRFIVEAAIKEAKGTNARRT